MYIQPSTTLQAVLSVVLLILEVSGDQVMDIPTKADMANRSLTRL